MTNNNEQLGFDFWADAEIISVYTRAQGLEDGELVDVSDMAKEAGFKYPVAITRNLHATITPSEKAKKYGQDYAGRLWDVLYVAMCEARRTQGDHSTFTVLFQNGPGNRNRNNATLWAICGPGDTAEPVITIMHPEDY